MNRLYGGLSVDEVVVTMVEPHTFSSTGPLAAAAGKSRIYLESGYAVETVRAAVNTSPTGAGSAVTVDVNKNGVSIYSNPADLPSIAAGSNTATGNAAAGVELAQGDYLTVDIDTVGSTDPGADLTVTVRLRKI